MKRLLTLLVALLGLTSAWATNYVKDVMLIGGSKSEVNSLKETYTGQGWTFIDYDLNKGCGSSSDYIYLLCKIESGDGVNKSYITDFYLSSQSGTAPDQLTHNERTYTIAPYDGGDHFKNLKGNLNSNAGGDDIHLYYTREAFSDWHTVSSISFNGNKSGAVGKDGTSTGYDLNAGAGGEYIYMHVTMATAKPVVVLTEETEEVTIFNGYTVTGSGGTYTHVSIADGATVTLDGITLNGKDWAITPWAGITCLGDATLVLAEGTINNIATGNNWYYYKYPAISIPAGKTLTIRGKGTVNAYANSGAGIGGGNEGSCGNITIMDGIVSAQSTNGAGIGSGYEGSCGDITIEGGTINAQSVNGAGIGSGNDASCGDITIEGGTVNVQSVNGAGIGSGEYGSCSDITIKGGTVNVQSTNGAGIGGGYQGSCGNITIEGGITQVIAYSKYDSPIGAGYGGSCGTVSIAANLNDVTEGKTRTLTPRSDVVLLTEETGEVTIPDGYTVMGTGGTYTHVCIADGATVTLDGITLNGKNWASTPWAGITCLGDATLVLAEGSTNNVGTDTYYHCNYPGIYVPEGKTLTIRGDGTVNATASYGAGIGGGDSGSCGNITIEGGTVNANSEIYGAGIGSGYDGSCGDITIKGGTVNATASYGAGIGSGESGSCGNITIEGGITKVVAYSDCYNPIGAGYDGTCGTVTIAESLNDVTEGETRTIAPFPVGIGEVSDEQTTSVVYDLQGRRVANPAKGVYIVDGKKVVKR